MFPTGNSYPKPIKPLESKCSELFLENCLYNTELNVAPHFRTSHISMTNQITQRRTTDPKPGAVTKVNQDQNI